MIVDFSPLREKNIQQQVTICIEEASKYASVMSLIDNSNIDKLGWGENVDVCFENEPIWRIPVFSFEVLFSVRSDSKKYAEAIAAALTGSQQQHEVDSTEIVHS